MYGSKDFTRYKEKIIRRYEDGDQFNSEWRVPPPLGKVYVSLQGGEHHFKKLPDMTILNADIKQDISPTNENQAFEKLNVTTHKEEIIRQGDLESFILEWLQYDDPDDSRMMLTGSYGIGKSSFCLHLAAKLLSSNEPNQRIPILIRLSEFAGRVKLDFRGFLVDHLKDSGVQDITTEKLESWARDGRLFFVFDGFDEMASRSVDLVKQANLDYIESWAKLPGNKVLVTTRPEYFLTRQEERYLLASYRQLHAHLLAPSQIDEYLEKRVGWHEAQLDPNETRLGWQRYRDEIKHIYDLRNLQHRFVLLEIIVQTLPWFLKQGRLQSNQNEITRVELYERYMEMELDKRQTKAKEVTLIAQLPTEERLKLLEELAWHLYADPERSNGRQFTAVEAWNWLEAGMNRETRTILRDNWSNFMTYSFLIPVELQDELFEFSHKSFLEYFVAKRLNQQLKDADFTGLAQSELTPEIADFLAELNPPTETLIETVDQAEASEKLVYSAGQLLLARRLYRLNRQLRIKEVESIQTYELDNSYITCLEYHVFVVERRFKNYLSYPDHWQSYRFSPGQACQPIAGLVDTDALVFIDWLNTRIQSKQGTNEVEKENRDSFVSYRYRLPSLKEVTLNSLPDQDKVTSWSRNFFKSELAQISVEHYKYISQALLRLSKTNTNISSERYNTLRLSSLELTQIDNNIFEFIFLYALGSNLGSVLDTGRVLKLVFARSYGLYYNLDRVHIFNTGVPIRAEVSFYVRLFDMVGVNIPMQNSAPIGTPFNTTKLQRLLKTQNKTKLLEELERIDEEETSKLKQKRTKFLKTLIDMALAQDEISYRCTQRACVAEYALLVYSILLKLEREQPRLLKWEQVKKAVSSLYWWTQIVEARIADPQFPVWESLRIVYERWSGRDGEG